MIYATFRTECGTWESIEAFIDLADAMEVLEFFAKGRPWLLSEDRKKLQGLVDAHERQLLAREVEHALQYGIIKAGT